MAGSRVKTKQTCFPSGWKWGVIQREKRRMKMMSTDMGVDAGAVFGVFYSPGLGLSQNFLENGKYLTQYLVK